MNGNNQTEVKHSSRAKVKALGVEWPTLATIALCYACWALATIWLPAVSVWLSILVAVVAIALHSSLQHEAIHGHPFRSARANAFVVFPALCLLIPFHRFRDTHLDHHLDADLTDPYDDPESQYLDPAVWHRFPRALQFVLNWNNTLLGRVIVGVLISQVMFLVSDLRAARAGDRRVIKGWLWHIPALALVAAWLTWVATIPIWAYMIAAYMGLSIIKIRTFLEHQADVQNAHRTVVIEDRGLLAFLFLNNNLHVVHHAHPQVPWYRLPAVYQANKDRYFAQNGGYLYRSYAQIFRRHLLRRKDPVPHPFWR